MQPSIETILTQLKLVHDRSSELRVREHIIRIRHDLKTIDTRLARLTRRLQHTADKLSPPG